MTETRAEKAQRLVDEGVVAIVHKGPYYTCAELRRQNELYFVTLYASGHFFCTCEWGRYRSHTHDLCVHALAVKLTVGEAT